MSIRMGPTAPPLHKQLGVSPDQVRGEQIILDVVTQANQLGTSASFTRTEHQKILRMLKDKGLLTKCTN